MTLLNYFLLFSSCMGTTASTTSADGSTSSGTSWWIIVIYVVIFAAFIYFLMIRPQKKQKKQQQETQNSMAPGDSVLTTSGFYGTIVAINGDVIIVEFGNNKNCRIPMSRQAISQLEKATSTVAGAAATPVEKVEEKTETPAIEEAAPAEAPAEEAPAEEAKQD